VLFNTHSFQVAKTFVCYSPTFSLQLNRPIINISNTRRHRCTGRSEINLEDCAIRSFSDGPLNSVISCSKQTTILFLYVNKIGRANKIKSTEE
jgi:hypothetical protein